jgi:hypothetical protein
VKRYRFDHIKSDNAFFVSSGSKLGGRHRVVDNGCVQGPFASGASPDDSFPFWLITVPLLIAWHRSNPAEEIQSAQTA